MLEELVVKFSMNRIYLWPPISRNEVNKQYIQFMHKFLVAGELETGVKIKLFAPDKRQRSKLPKNGTVGVMEYSTIGKFLPLSYHDSRLDMKHPVK